MPVGGVREEKWKGSEMTGLKRLVAVGAVALGLMVGASPAAAQGNPQRPDNPYAVVTHEKGEGNCVSTYKAPPAEGASPRTPARGGSPGYVENGSHGNACE